LNIQFIIDAFTSEKTKTKAPTPFLLVCRKLALNNLDFVYADAVSGTTVTTGLQFFESTGISFSTMPNAITISDVTLRQAHADIVTASAADQALDSATVTPISGFMPDFGIGMAIAIGNLDIEDCYVSFH